MPSAVLGWMGSVQSPAAPLLACFIRPTCMLWLLHAACCLQAALGVTCNGRSCKARLLRATASCMTCGLGAHAAAWAPICAAATRAHARCRPMLSPCCATWPHSSCTCVGSIHAHTKAAAARVHGLCSPCCATWPQSSCTCVGNIHAHTSRC